MSKLRFNLVVDQREKNTENDGEQKKKMKNYYNIRTKVKFNYQNIVNKHGE